MEDAFGTEDLAILDTAFQLAGDMLDAMGTTQITQLIRELLANHNDVDHNRVIRTLVSIGGPAVDPLLAEIKSSGYKGRRAVIYKVFKEMGYPLNEPALPYAVGAIQDINHPGWDDAANIIMAAGIKAVPFLRDMIKLYIREPSENGYEIQGIVGLFDIMEPKIVSEVMPELTELLKGIPPDTPMYKWVNEIIQKIKLEVE